MEIDYPDLEVIAVDDRSRDATGRILDEFAAAHPCLRVVHVAELPAGWLGKPHALQKAYEASTGEWLLFTDADVRFKPDVLRRHCSRESAQPGTPHAHGRCRNGGLLGDRAYYFFWHGV